MQRRVTVLLIKVYNTNISAQSASAAHTLLVAVLLPRRFFERAQAVLHRDGQVMQAYQVQGLAWQMLEPQLARALRPQRPS